MMMLFSKFGNWFLRNSRNVFLIFVINYIVMIQVGSNLVGNLVWFLLSSELNNVFAKVGAYGDFESLADINVVISRLFYPTGFLLMFCFIAFFSIILIFFLMRINVLNLSNRHIKIILLSQFMVIIFMFFDLISRMPDLALFRLGFSGIEKLLIYSISMFCTNLVFWFFYYKIWLNPEQNQQH